MRLGDLVYYFTKYTGIRWLVKNYVKVFLRKDDCGCDRRREEWNDIEIDIKDVWSSWIK